MCTTRSSAASIPGSGASRSSTPRTRCLPSAVTTRSRRGHGPAHLVRAHDLVLRKRARASGRRSRNVLRQTSEVAVGRTRSHPAHVPFEVTLRHTAHDPKGDECSRGRSAGARTMYRHNKNSRCGWSPAGHRVSSPPRPPPPWRRHTYHSASASLAAWSPVTARAARVPRRFLALAWCKPERCYGDIIAATVNAEERMTNDRWLGCG